MPVNNYSWMYMAIGLFIVAAVMILSKLVRTKKTKQQSFFDPLTGGRTETAYQTGVRKVLEGRADSYAMISMQISNLSHVFTAFGADEAERTLRHIHSALESQLSSEELMGRTGEDVFSFVLKNRKPEEICARLDRICDAINRPGGENIDPYLLNMRFGIYLPEKGERNIINMQSRTVQARMSLPVGRRYQFYDRAAWDKNAWEREMAKNIDYALQTSEFVVFYQPKVRVVDQRVAGMEALVRWRYPQRGLLSPDMFMPVAEHFQKISRIDRFVFEDICRTLARWSKQGRELCPISVNLAEADIGRPSLADECGEICAKYGVEPANIEFEIKESLLLSNMETAATLIERLHAVGFRCAVDNFGAGAVSMQILSTLDIDTVKLDRSFFSGDNDNRRGRFIVEAIIKLATQLQICTVAQGVDNPGQVKYLQQVACDMIQGFYYFKPMALEQLESEAFEGGVLKYAEGKAAPAREQGEKKHLAHAQTEQGNKNLVFFSYLPEEDTVEFSEAFSPIFGNRRKFSDALALFRTTELIHENDREDFFRLLDRCQREEGWVENTLRFYMAEGRYGWLEMHMRRDGYDSGSVISGALINMSEWNKEINRWKEKANRDALTGLYNREYFEHSVRTLMEQKTYTSAAMLFIDVDDFKRVNDTLGHMFGDDVLCYVAKQILGVFRHTDVIARFGGDEFVVFAPAIQRATLEDRLKRLCGAFQYPYRNDTLEYKVSGSIGAAMYPQDGTDYDTLLEHADCALYEAKNLGKDQYVVYEPYMLGEPSVDKGGEAEGR